MASRTCRAAIMMGARTLEIGHLELPDAPGPAEAIVRVEACGVCGTDYEQYSGAYADGVHARYPILPGHEPVVVIEAIGSAAQSAWQVSEGDMVAVEPLVACGSCRACANDRRLLCERPFLYGFGTASVGGPPTGAFAERMVLHGTSLVHRIPPGVTARDAAFFNALAGGLGWTLGAGRVRAGDAVLVLGPGPRGLACVIAAERAGASQILLAGLSRDRRRLDVGSALGATHVIDVQDVDVVDAVREVTNGRMADVAIDVTPVSTDPVVQALRSVRPGGSVVLAGLKGHREARGFVSDVVIDRALRVVGVRGAPSWAYALAVEIIGERAIELRQLHSHTVPLDNAEWALEVLGGEHVDESPLHVALMPGTS